MKWYKRHNKTLLLFFPVTLFSILLISYGVLHGIIESLQSTDGGVSLHVYQELFSNTVFIQSIKFSLRVTMVSTVMSLIIGLISAKFIYHLLQKSHLKLLVWLPMIFPHFVAAYMVFSLFSSSGIIASIFYSVELISDQSQFPVLTMDRDGLGIMMTYIWKEVPFVILMLIPVFYEIDNRYDDVVRTLGGNSWNVFWTVEWKWLLPVIIETFIILFAFIIAAYEVPFLVGATNPKMIAIIAYQWFFEGDWSNRPLALAAFICITLLILVTTAVSFMSIQRLRTRLIRGKI
ncbi:ABC transporter permease [Bacillus sp. SCS-151]|uniref:ABC transporter permease n=1 Tax=Nanhaiella sioensis TaxID=3115293 RepID=UPI00397B574E